MHLFPDSSDGGNLSPYSVTNTNILFCEVCTPQTGSFTYSASPDCQSPRHAKLQLSFSTLTCQTPLTIYGKRKNPMVRQSCVGDDTDLTLSTDVTGFKPQHPTIFSNLSFCFPLFRSLFGGKTSRTTKCKSVVQILRISVFWVMAMIS
jgi:hypothetical protein